MTTSQGIGSRTSRRETKLSLLVSSPVLDKEDTCTITIDMIAMLRHEDDDIETMSLLACLRLRVLGQHLASVGR